MTGEEQIDTLTELIRTYLLNNKEATPRGIARFLWLCGYCHKGELVNLDEVLRVRRESVELGAKMLFREIKFFCDTKSFKGRLSLRNIEEIMNKMIEGWTK